MPASVERWNDVTIRPGERKNVYLAVGERYSSATLRIPLQVRRGKKPGPTIFVSAALHGDEINGTGTIREILLDESFRLLSGALILVPVINLLGFERHSRYLPDRRDLNRCFPGSKSGSLSSRVAKIVFDEIVKRSDFGIDLHTAAVRRTNFPNVRGDRGNPGVQALADAFGAEAFLCSSGTKGTLRREACRRGCPTITVEGGEVWKVQPGIVSWTLRGIRNVLSAYGMLKCRPKRPAFQLVIERSQWIRAEHGGFLKYHVRPGELVRAGEPLTTNTSLLGHEHNTLHAPCDGMVLGLATLPAVTPGEPVCHLGELPAEQVQVLRCGARNNRRRETEALAQELATSVLVVPPDDPRQNKRRTAHRGPRKARAA